MNISKLINKLKKYREEKGEIDVLMEHSKEYIRSDKQTAVGEIQFYVEKYDIVEGQDEWLIICGG